MSLALVFPRSVFSDLTDLDKAEVEKSPNGYILTLRGGDASEGYLVKIEFDAMRVRRRSVFTGEEPDKLVQETTYYRVILGR
jgi:hypothetical protein